MVLGGKQEKSVPCRAVSSHGLRESVVGPLGEYSGKFSGRGRLWAPDLMCVASSVSQKADTSVQDTSFLVGECGLFSTWDPICKNTRKGHGEAPREACSAPVSPTSPGFPPERTCLRMGMSFFRSWARSLLPKSQDLELREWGPRLAVSPAPLVLLVVPFAFLLFPSPPGSEVRTRRTLFSPQLFHQLST